MQLHNYCMYSDDLPSQEGVQSWVVLLFSCGREDTIMHGTQLNTLYTIIITQINTTKGGT
jgi:hypothetical protein